MATQPDPTPIPPADAVEHRETDTPSELSTEVKAPVEEPGTPDEAPATLAAALTKSAKHQTLRDRLFGSKKRTAGTVTGLIIILCLVVVLSPLKYPALGWAIKSELVVTVSDSASGQVLPGAVVNVAGASLTTDKLGVAHFTSLHPGHTTLSVTKAAYEVASQAVTLKFGDNGSQGVKVSSKGIRVTFNLTNYVTGQPVAGARVTLADADVVSDSSGRAVASVTPAGNDGQTETATIALDGFNNATASVKVTPGAAPLATKLVPAGSVYYLSNKSGRVDLYQSNLDGSAATVVLAGTGNEDTSTGILPNVYDPTVLALVSSRAGKRVDGNIQDDLYIFHTDTRQLTAVDTSIPFQNYRAWLGKTLIYQKYSDSNGSSHPTIESYTPATNKHATIAACTSDNACPTALYTTDDIFLFTLAGAPGNSSSNGLFVVKQGNVSAQSVSKSPADSAYRQVKNTLLLQYYVNPIGGYEDPAWQSLDLSSVKVSALPAGPATTTSRTYVDSPGDKYSVSVDKRDGQSDLYVTDENGANEHQLTNTGNVDQFVQWFGDSYIVYSAANQLYAVGVAGGAPQKITNFYSGEVHIYSGGYNPNYY